MFRFFLKAPVLKSLMQSCNLSIHFCQLQFLEKCHLTGTPDHEGTARGVLKRAMSKIKSLHLCRVRGKFPCSPGIDYEQLLLGIPLETKGMMLPICSLRCSGKRIDAAAWEEGMAALSAPLRAPFARQFQGAPTMEVGPGVGFGNGVAVTDRRMENKNEWRVKAG